jgi:hypothetical protein
MFSWISIENGSPLAMKGLSYLNKGFSQNQMHLGSSFYTKSHKLSKQTRRANLYILVNTPPY